MKDIELPPLPRRSLCEFDGAVEIDLYTKEQMQSYARAAVEADRAQRVPEIDYEALIHAGWKNHKYAQGTRGCMAFKHGAEWFRSVLLASTPAQPAQQERKPMTEQERQELYVSLLNESASGPGGMFKIIVEAIERHHGIRE